MLQSTESPRLTRVPVVLTPARTPIATAVDGTQKTCIRTEDLSAFFGERHAIKNVSTAIPQQAVTAIIGPSGCGKSTLLRCLNRMHETVPGARVEGQVEILGTPIYGEGTSPTAVRRHVGMVFQRPTPFPTMSIRANVVAGLKVGAKQQQSRSDLATIVEEALVRAGLWDEVKDRLDDSAMALSGGQQQRLCIARALATRPRVILLDEPTASLDPLSTQKVEELVYELRKTVTVVIVTHNMQQAARVSDCTAFLLAGELIEFAPTSTLFTAPSDSRTEAYITGRFG
ncbi:MAG TPA: phosphate ABC transporter ATP-binding protein PstB [Steroidobacteraceae bacterium]|nr:phosphate ABC transporter ATP-binding protein PstB [Steroidobacteraceae bacterium]